MLKSTNIIVLPWLVLFVLMALTNISFSADARKNNDNTISWINYSEAMSEGMMQQKNILLYFTDPGDMWCDKMQLETFSDRQVIKYLNKHFIMCEVDIARLPILAKKYKVDALPAIWFLDPKGKGLTTTDGFMPPRQLLLILQFIQEESYKETTFKQWKEKRPRR